MAERKRLSDEHTVATKAEGRRLRRSTRKWNAARFAMRAVQKDVTTSDQLAVIEP